MSPAERRRRQRRQAARRKAKRWEKALEDLESPIALILAVDEEQPVPLLQLPLLAAKKRIDELNILLATSRREGDLHPPSNLGRDELHPALPINPEAPPVLRATTPIDLSVFLSRYSSGIEMYRVLVRRGKIQPAAGEGWSVFRHADLRRSLPSVNLQHCRRRDWYILRMTRGVEGEVLSIRAWSISWRPIFERRLRAGGIGNSGPAIAKFGG